MMREPRRLLDEGADEFERELLRSSSEDAGSGRLLERTMVASGLATASVAVAAAAKAATAGAAAAKSAHALEAAAAGVAHAQRVLLLKWITIGALGGFATFGAIEYARAPAQGANAPELVPVAAAPCATPSVAAPSVVARDDKAEPEGESEPEPQPEHRAAPTAETKRDRAPELEQSAASAPPPASNAVPANGPTPAAAASSPSPIMMEIASLERARGPLGAGDAARALRELDRHERDFPRGALAPEATALRIEALVRSGDRAGAAALADRFLKTPGGAAHAKRIRSLVGASASSNP
jgi:hypothetical protein